MPLHRSHIVIIHRTSVLCSHTTTTCQPPGYDPSHSGFSSLIAVVSRMLRLLSNKLNRVVIEHELKRGHVRTSINGLLPALMAIGAIWSDVQADGRYSTQPIRSHQAGDEIAVLDITDSATTGVFIGIFDTITTLQPASVPEENKSLLINWEPLSVQLPARFLLESTDASITSGLGKEETITEDAQKRTMMLLAKSQTPANDVIKTLRAQGEGHEIFDMRIFCHYHIDDVLKIMSRLPMIKAIVLSRHKGIEHHMYEICRRKNLQTLLIPNPKISKGSYVDLESIWPFHHIDIYHPALWDRFSNQSILKTTDHVGQVIFIGDENSSRETILTSISGTDLTVQTLEKRIVTAAHTISEVYDPKVIARDLALVISVDPNFTVRTMVEELFNFRRDWGQPCTEDLTMYWSLVIDYSGEVKPRLAIAKVESDGDRYTLASNKRKLGSDSTVRIREVKDHQRYISVPTDTLEKVFDKAVEGSRKSRKVPLDCGDTDTDEI
ncbi:hypothetical protein CLCR_10057 [Cladophialophora carrionii]|uniref:Uncharacterized protein n=1 Tax=Cladophialophora carrionii TaxID=86049 RepID=A0A1C1CW25_9EURO|nr:hypothetical protein CLCR_10057 [Cladophialophora carrionii]